MKLNWKSVKAAHVTRACEAILNSAGAEPKPGDLIVIYKDKRLPAKTILRIAYCLANDIPSEPKLKFASSEVVFNFCGRWDFERNDCRLTILSRIRTRVSSSGHDIFLYPC